MISGSQQGYVQKSSKTSRENVQHCELKTPLGFVGTLSSGLLSLIVFDSLLAFAATSEELSISEYVVQNLG